MTALEQRLHRFFTQWGNWILRAPILLLSLILLLTGAAVYYTLSHLTINTDTTELIAPEASFQKNRRTFEKAFPHDVNTLLLMLESDSPELTLGASKRLTRLLVADKENFELVYVPNDSGFFQRNGLLYLELNELQDIASSLTQAQPFMGRLAENNSLEGLFSILNDALVNSDKQQDLPIEITPLLTKIEKTTHKILNNENDLLSWQQLMMNNKSNSFNSNRSFIIVRPKFDYSDILPIEKPVAKIRQMIKQIQDPNLPEVKVWITGEIGLEHDEMEGVSQGTFTASLFSIGLVCVILLIAFRSINLMLVTLTTLLIGMAFCGLFASIIVKELNLISVAFMVSNIGLGVEYAIHFCLRYRDYLKSNISKEHAIRGTLVSTSPSLLLCASTTAIGLYAFIPTDYRGISELGLLAGSSLFICLFITLTVLPILLLLIPKPHLRANELGISKPSPLMHTLTSIPLHFARPIIYITVLLSVIAGLLLFKLTVDFNPINIRDPNTESVIAFKKLLKTQDTSPMTLSVLANTPEKTRQLQDKIEKLAVVDKTVSLFDFVPPEQIEKLAIMDELSLVMGTQSTHFPSLKQGTDPKPAIEQFLTTLKNTLPQCTNKARCTALMNLQVELQGVLIELENRQQPNRQAFIEKLQNSILGALPMVMNELSFSLNPEEITLDILPPDLKNRWLSVQGLYRVQIFPKKDLNDLENLEEFISQVQSVEANTTDLPVLFWESMKEVVKAFKQAITIAIVTITLLLLVMRRNAKDTLLVIIPLLLAGLFTMGSTALTGTPINFANIIALPLLLGLGVDNGIHMLEKLRHSVTEEQNIYQSSTARGIFYGALTTVSSFAGLAFSPHQGVASMGLVITIGIFWIMIGTFVILPALSKLVLQGQPQQ
jgi:hopanoid biosynthesis associated RND transporter like protein HpnN